MDNGNSAIKHTGMDMKKHFVSSEIMKELFRDTAKRINPRLEEIRKRRRRKNKLD